MLTIQIGVTDKRINSTQIPSNDLWINSRQRFTNCTFKEGTSFETPTVQIYTENDLSNCNYMTISRADNVSKKFYWITDIRQVNNVWEITGRKDNLAQYRDQIGELTPYILRCSGLGWNHDIFDEACIFSKFRTYVNKISAAKFMPLQRYDGNVNTYSHYFLVNMVGLKMTTKDFLGVEPHKVNSDDVIESQYILVRCDKFEQFLAVIESQITDPQSTCDWSLANNLISCCLLQTSPGNFDLFSKPEDTTHTQFYLKQIKQMWIEGTPSGAGGTALSVRETVNYIRNNPILINEDENEHPSYHYIYAVDTKQTGFYRDYDIKIPVHPDYPLTEYEWLKRHEGTQSIDLFFGPMGKMSIPVDKLNGEDIKMRLYINAIENMATAILKSSQTETLLGVYTATPFFPSVQISNIIDKTKQYQWAQQDKPYNIGGAIVSTLLGITGAAALGPAGIGVGVAGAVQGASSIRSAQVSADRVTSSQTEVVGKDGSFNGWFLFQQEGLVINVLWKEFNWAKKELLGRPMYRVDRVNRAGDGIIVCGTIDTKGLVGAMPDEIADIVTHMQGGFYFE